MCQPFQSVGAITTVGTGRADFLHPAFVTGLRGKVSQSLTSPSLLRSAGSVEWHRDRPTRGRLPSLPSRAAQLQADLQPTNEIPDHLRASSQWLDWPVDRWLDEQQGRKWFRRAGERFVFAIPCAHETRAAFERMTGEVVD